MTSERDVHPDEGTIHAWLDRQLDDTSSATLEAHLQRCDECAERVAEARGLIAGTSRILSALDVGEPPITTIAPDSVQPASAPAVEPWRPVLLPTPRPQRTMTFRLTPARSAIAAVLVVAVGLAIVHENERPSSRLASIAAESSAVANAPMVTNAPAVAGVPAVTNAPAVTAAPMVAAAPTAGATVGATVGAAAPRPASPEVAAATPPLVADFDSTAGARVAAARTFARAQRETTVNADLARVAQARAPAAKTSEVPIPVPMTKTSVAGLEAPQCFRVESASGAAATWGPVSLPMVLALDAPATNGTVRVLTPAGQTADAGAVLERRGNDSLLFTLRRIGYSGTLAVGAPGEVRAGVMRSSPSAMQLESVVVTGAAPAPEPRRALRQPSAAQSRADSAAATANRAPAPAVPVVVRRVECRGE